MIHFIIIGEAKCGTTSLYGYLTEHPQVSLSSNKEPNFFRSSLHDWTNKYKLRNRFRHLCLQACALNPISRAIVRNKYFRVIERRPGFVSGDGSINYFSTTGMARRIRIYLPQAKLILMLRNPVDRSYSNFWMNVRQRVGDHRYASFEEFIDSGGWYRPNNLYAENLREWLRYFPLEQIFLIKSEDFFQSPQEILNELFMFLGVQKHKFSHEIHATPYASSPNQYPPMKEHTRRRLTNIFSYQQYHLFELTGRDFGWF